MWFNKMNFKQIRIKVQKIIAYITLDIVLYIGINLFSPIPFIYNLAISNVIMVLSIIYQVKDLES